MGLWDRECLVNYHVYSSTLRVQNINIYWKSSLERISIKDIQASWASSSWLTTFFSSGCFSGSLVQLHILSFPRFLVTITLLRVCLGGGLERKWITEVRSEKWKCVFDVDNKKKLYTYKQFILLKQYSKNVNNLKHVVLCYSSKSFTVCL